MKLIIDIPEEEWLFTKAKIVSEDDSYVDRAVAHGTPIPDNATNGELFKQIFGICATELWSKSESEFLEWLNGRYQKGGKEEYFGGELYEGEFENR